MFKIIIINSSEYIPNLGLDRELYYSPETEISKSIIDAAKRASVLLWVTDIHSVIPKRLGTTS